MSRPLRLTLAILLVRGLAAIQEPAQAQGVAHEQHHRHGHVMSVDGEGMTMNENRDALPRDCEELSRDLEIEVRVGRRYAHTGRTFGFDRHEWRVPPCARLRVTLVNEDQVRHQWMVHGLPRYLYPQGMFHLEVHGGQRRSASFIVPSDNRTYLVHCDLAQHMEQGLKAQLVVGTGSGALPSVPGISGPRRPERY